MFEVDEGVSPFCVLFAREFGPAFHIFFGVIFPAESKITVIGGDPLRSRNCVSIGNTERDITRAKQIENLVVEPGFVTELERAAH